MSMEYIPPEFDDDINVNVTAVNPLVNFGYLLATVAVTGIAVFSGLGFAGSILASNLGPETEAKIGDTMVSSLLETGDVQTDDERRPYLEDLIHSFYATGESPRLPLKVYVMDSPMPNAFIVPGGHIFVTSELLDNAETENELAFVLAHELGHFEARDNLKRMGRSLVFLTLSSLLDFGGGGSGTVSGAVNLTELRYGRGQESKADEFAIRAIVQKYGHGGNSLDFFAKLEALDDLPIPDIELLSSHPLTDKRIRTLEAFARARGMKMEGEATQLPDNLACLDFKPCP